MNHDEQTEAIVEEVKAQLRLNDSRDRKMIAAIRVAIAITRRHLMMPTHEDTEDES